VNSVVNEYFELVIYFFGSGLAFFIGAGLVLVAVVAKTLCRVPVLSRKTTLTGLVGLILVGVSAAPLPYWFYALLAAATLGWLITESRLQRGSKCPLAALRIAVCLLWLAAIAWEGQYLIAAISVSIWADPTAPGRMAWHHADSQTLLRRSFDCRPRNE
jgi:hypothetical protein